MNLRCFLYYSICIEYIKDANVWKDLKLNWEKETKNPARFPHLQAAVEPAGFGRLPGGFGVFQGGLVHGDPLLQGVLEAARSRRGDLGFLGLRYENTNLCESGRGSFARAEQNRLFKRLQIEQEAERGASGNDGWK